MTEPSSLSSSDILHAGEEAGPSDLKRSLSPKMDQVLEQPVTGKKRSKWTTLSDEENDSDQRTDIKIRKRALKVKVKGRATAESKLVEEQSPRKSSETTEQDQAILQGNRERSIIDIHEHASSDAPPEPSDPPIPFELPLPLIPRSHLVPPRTSHPELCPCRSVYSYTRLNHIEEGTYGIVFRARCNQTNKIYALKKLKLEEEKQGFPITSLREVMALMITGSHENVVGVREIVVGDTLNQ